MSTIISLDLETTGTNPATDRIIEVAFVVQTDVNREPWRWLVNPGCPIPAAATAVHHITDDMVRTASVFAEIADEITTLIAQHPGALFVGFNAASLDLPILRAEFERAGLTPPVLTPLYDACEVFRSRERHTLPAAVKRYLGRAHENAHSAVADASAHLDVALAQIAEYGLAELAGQALCDAAIGRDPSWATACGRLRWDASGRLVWAFGKHNGQPVTRAHAAYVAWVLKADFPADLKAALRGVK